MKEAKGIEEERDRKRKREQRARVRDKRRSMGGDLAFARRS